MMRNIKFLILLFVFLQYSNATLQAKPIGIGAIFFEDELEMKNHFEEIVKTINIETQLNFVPIIKHLNEKDGTSSIALQREACDLIDSGVSVIFGPSSKAKSDIVSQICNYTGIPHLLFDSANERENSESNNHQMTLNVFPSQPILSKAYADVIHRFGWMKFTLIYDAEDEQAQNKFQDILQLRDLHADTVRVYEYRRDGDFRTLWKSIVGERRIILDAEPDIVVDLLNASIPFNLTGELNNIFLTNLETHCANLEELRDNKTFSVNITAARLRLNYNDLALYTFDPNGQSQPRTLLRDMIYDALHVFTYAVQNFSQSFVLPSPRTSCDFSKYSSFKPWDAGIYLNNLMRSISGVDNNLFRTSNLQFDDSGERANFNIEIHEPMKNRGIAYWDTKGQFTPINIGDGQTERIVYRISTRIGKPYFMLNLKAQEQNLTGENDQYEGYAVDLIDKIAKDMDFEYKFYPVPDQEYGTYNEHTKQWNGIIGTLVNHDAHMGICDLTITQARKKAVDFTVPFMQLGLRILAYREPIESKPWYCFLDPFGANVWITVMLAIIAMSLLFVFMARISKEEWENPHPCNKNPEALENIWDLSSTFWLTASSITTAGSDILPKGPAMRTFNSMWWVFAIIIANSYTANLAAFLTNDQRQGSVTGLSDLTEQTEVKYGTIKGGSTHNFFAESNDTVYRLAFNFMDNANPSPYTKGNEEGVKRVKRSRGKYMFLMETTSLEYNVNNDCDLRAVGEKFAEKHYAIAVPMDAPYRVNLSVSILKLSERGELFALKEKWWKKEDGDKCEEESTENKDDLKFENVRGIFYTLLGGVFCGFVAGIIEFVNYTRKKAFKEKILLKHMMARELKVVLHVSTNRKPINTPSESLHSSSRRSSNKTGKGSAESAILKSSEEVDENEIEDAMVKGEKE